MPLKLGADDVAALYVGTAAVDAAFLGADDVTPDEGGGGEPYVAEAVTLAEGTSIDRDGGLVGVVDGPTGFVSHWVKPNVLSTGVDFLFGTGGNFEIRVENGGVGESVLQTYFGNVEGELFQTNDSTEDAMVFGQWNHLLVAWDVGHEGAEKLLAAYLNDAKIATAFDPFGSTESFNVDYSSANIFSFISRGTGNFETLNSASDSGLWLNTSILESDGTISEINRRKFIDTLGKPADPANWPANPVIKFIGNAASFATNQGSGGAFAVTGSLTDADTSPSD